MDKVSVGLNVDLGSTIAEAKASLAKLKENRTYDKAAYTTLLDKYSAAIQLIESLKSQIEQLEKQAGENKLPSSDEIENLAKMLDVIEVFNDKLPAIQKLQKSVGNL